MFSPPSHPFSPPNPSSSTANQNLEDQAWYPTSSPIDPPRTIERKRKHRAYPYFPDHNAPPDHDQINSDKGIGAHGPTPPRARGKHTHILSGPVSDSIGISLGMAPSFELDPSTGLPTPEQTIKRDKRSIAAARARLSQVRSQPLSTAHSRTQSAQDDQMDGKSSPPAPPTPLRQPGFSLARTQLQEGKSLTYLSSTYCADGRAGLESFGRGGGSMGLMTPERDGTAGQTPTSLMATVKGSPPDTIRASLYVEEDRAMGESAAIGASGGQFGRRRRPGLMFARSMGFDPSTGGGDPVLFSFSNPLVTAETDNATIDSPHADRHPHVYSIIAAPGPGAGGLGVGMRNTHARSKNGRRTKSNVDSVRLFRSSGAAADAGGSGGERSLGPPVRILLDSGSNPFLDEEDGRKQHEGSHKEASAWVDKLLFGGRAQQEEIASALDSISEGGRLDVNMDNDVGLHPQHQPQEEEGDGDYEIEIEADEPLQPALTSNSGSSSDSTMSSPDETGAEGLVDPATPEALTPLAAGTVRAFERSTGGSTMSRHAHDNALTISSNRAERSSSNHTPILPSIHRPTTTSNASGKKHWPPPTLGPFGTIDDDESENPFLVGPGRKGKVMSADERERRRLAVGSGGRERETVNYVFRGTKTTFANPNYHLSFLPTPQNSSLRPEHPEFSPAALPKPRLLFRDAHERASAGLVTGLGEKGKQDRKETSDGDGDQCAGRGGRKLDVDEEDGLDSVSDEELDTARPTRRLLFGSTATATTATKTSTRDIPLLPTDTQSAKTEQQASDSRRGVKHPLEAEDGGHILQSRISTRASKRTRTGLAERR